MSYSIANLSVSVQQPKTVSTLRSLEYALAIDMKGQDFGYLFVAYCHSYSYLMNWLVGLLIFMRYS